MPFTENASGELLRRARQTAGLSLDELATRSGVTPTTLSAYEDGKRSPLLEEFLHLVYCCDLAISFAPSGRVRWANGRSRGEELIDVLRLAEQFPSRANELPEPINVARLLTGRGKRD